MSADLRGLDRTIYGVNDHAVLGDPASGEVVAELAN
jgi:hypothetical protein